MLQWTVQEVSSRLWYISCDQRKLIQGPLWDNSIRLYMFVVFLFVSRAYSRLRSPQVLSLEDMEEDGMLYDDDDMEA